MIKKYLLLFSLLLWSGIVHGKRSDSPSVVYGDDTLVIVMSQKISTKLKNWDSEARILQLEEFSNKIWQLYSPHDPTSAPMAASGDFNGDQKMDLGFLVQSGNWIKVLVALSEKEDYFIHEVKRFPIAEVTDEKPDPSITVKKQFKVYLFAEKRNFLRYEPGVIKREALQIEQYNSNNTTLHYATGQKIYEYKGRVLASSQ